MSDAWRRNGFGDRSLKQPSLSLRASEARTFHGDLHRRASLVQLSSAYIPISCLTQVRQLPLAELVWVMYLLSLLVVILIGLSAVVRGQDASTWPRILLFTKTAGFRHDSIPAAVDVVTRLGTGELSLAADNVDSSVASGRWTTVHSEDASKFEDQAYLNGFDAVVFAFTTDEDPPKTGSLLTDAQASNFLKYIAQGGNFVGIHSATNTLYQYPAYGRLAGGFFTYHAQSQDVTLKPLVRDHPSTSKLPSAFKIKEEMYHLRSNPRDLPSPARVLLSNASSYADPGGRRGEGTPQPLAWYRVGSLLNSTASSLNGDLDGQNNFSGGAGRSWVTTLGHEIATWANPSFQGHIKGGIGWVLSVSTQSVGDTTSNSSSSSAAPSSSSSPSSSPSSAAVTKWATPSWLAISCASMIISWILTLS
ncbi:unnamed protein product [Parajaminaea phylloscopi]